MSSKNIADTNYAPVVKAVREEILNDKCRCLKWAAALILLGGLTAVVSGFYGGDSPARDLVFSIAIAGVAIGFSLGVKAHLLREHAEKLDAIIDACEKDDSEAREKAFFALSESAQEQLRQYQQLGWSY